MNQFSKWVKEIAEKIDIIYDPERKPVEGFTWIINSKNAYKSYIEMKEQINSKEILKTLDPDQETINLLSTTFAILSSFGELEGCCYDENEDNIYILCGKGIKERIEEKLSDLGLKIVKTADDKKDWKRVVSYRIEVHPILIPLREANKMLINAVVSEIENRVKEYNFAYVDSEAVYLAV